MNPLLYFVLIGGSTGPYVPVTSKIITQGWGTAQRLITQGYFGGQPDTTVGIFSDPAFIQIFGGLW
jgi:hypothetical protein